MSFVLAQHLICAQFGLLTAAIIMTALEQMRVNSRYLKFWQLYTLKRTCFCLAVSLLKCWLNQPAISNLKTIGTDLEKAIFNNFLSQIKDLKLLLCAFHLHQNDKRKLTERKPKGGSQTINKILADIYGRQYSTMMEYGLAGLQRCQWLTTRLESLR